jgi:hypothetical protein
MKSLAGGNERTVRRGILDAPGPTAVAAAREQVFLGFLAIDIVTFGAEVFVIARTEANQYLVAPRPNSVVGRPAAEAAKLGVNFDVTSRLNIGRSRGG